MPQPSENLFAKFTRHFPADTSVPLLHVPGGQSYAYNVALDESARIACCLQNCGLQPGDRVTVQVEKSPAALWLYLACLRGGFVFHPLNIDYQADELKYFVNDAEPAVVICDPAREVLFRQLTQKANCTVLTLDANGEGSLVESSRQHAPQFNDHCALADDTAVLLYSSGTTGVPKGAMLSHGNLAANTATLVEHWGFTANDVLLHALPIYHAHGLFVAVGCVLMSGSSMLFLPRFDRDAIIAALPRATVMMGVPTFYTRLLDDPRFNRELCTKMRLFISGSAPLRPETFMAFQQRSGHTILERYGMTETSMNTSNPLHGERRAGSVGLPLPGVSLRVVDDMGEVLPAGTIGHLQVKGPNVFRGYWHMPDKTAQEFTSDGYFKTGDEAVIDHDGYITIVGRAKDMVISGGLNVYPREIEALLDTLPGVAESAVIGAPHPDFGEGVIAVVVAEAGATLSESILLEQLRPRLAAYKLPKRVFLVTELPRNTLGKVLKNELRDCYADTFST
jgi:malonyl-CoA/methylmalonyl-CoA synthetase